jgi:hypothetical protein
MAVLVVGGKRSQVGEALAQPALVPFGLVELTASLSNGIPSPNEATAQAPVVLEGGQGAAADAEPLELAVKPALTPAVTMRSTGSRGTSGAARWTQQSKGLKPARKVPPGTSGTNKKPELVVHEPAFLPSE